ncbi:aquaporin AQPAn.G [Folsomia candida]|uniref:Aquaporin AQPAn.G n=1 Tax=Folsomia candida TaxID=158441 RepID=A0A226EVA4_FOLCA|nr:aquaporin AQPAn.G [Folsomia candida]OXA61533.1 Aquaporin AQPAn.G [Folsomia candida]
MPKKMDEVFGLQEVREQRMPLFKALVAEFLGLVLLVFFGCGTANACARGLIDGRPLPPDFITCVSLAFGLTIAGTAQAIGHISGGHINPAVTLGILVSGKLSLLRGVLYMIAQFLGGIVGAALLKAVVPDAADWPQNHLGANGLQTGVQAYQGMIVEAMVTFILVLVVYGCCDSRRDDVKGSIPLAIGLTVTLSHLLSIGFTGAGLNPARTLGPAILTGKFDDLWVYFVGPFLGAAIAGILYTVLFKHVRPVPSEDF